MFGNKKDKEDEKPETEPEINLEEKPETEEQIEISGDNDIDQEEQEIKLDLDDLESDKPEYDFNMAENVEEIENREPDVSQHVVGAENMETEQINSDSIMDQSNPPKVFDRTIHLSDSIGNPLFTKTGRFRKIPKKKIKKSDASIGLEPEKTPDQIQAETVDQESVALAKMTALTVSRIRSSKFFGAEKMEVEELEYFENALKIWSDANDIVLSPNLGLVMASVVVMSPVFAVPLEQSPFKQMAVKIVKPKKKIKDPESIEDKEK